MRKWTMRYWPYWSFRSSLVAFLALPVAGPLMVIGSFWEFASDAMLAVVKAFYRSDWYPND